MENKKKTLLKQYIDFFETIPTDYGFDNQEAEKLTEFWPLFYCAAAYCYDLEQMPRSLTGLINQVTPYHITIVRRCLVNTYYHFTYNTSISKKTKSLYQEIYWEYARSMAPFGREMGIDLQYSEMLFVKLPNNLTLSKEVNDLVKDPYFFSNGFYILDNDMYLYTNIDMVYCVRKLDGPDGPVPARNYLKILRAEL